MKSRSLLTAAMLMLFIAGSAWAQSFDYEEELYFTLVAEPQALVPGDSGVLMIYLECPLNIAISSDEQVFSLVMHKRPDSISFDELQVPEETSPGYFGQYVTLQWPFTISEDCAEGDHTVQIGFRLQACDMNTGMCYLPSTEKELIRTAIITVSKKEKQ